MWPVPRLAYDRERQRKTDRQTEREREREREFVRSVGHVIVTYASFVTTTRPTLLTKPNIEPSTIFTYAPTVART
jgi:hypothetical protein